MQSKQSRKVTITGVRTNYNTARGAYNGLLLQLLKHSWQCYSVPNSTNVTVTFIGQFGKHVNVKKNMNKGK